MSLSSFNATIGNNKAINVDNVTYPFYLMTSFTFITLFHELKGVLMLLTIGWLYIPIVIISTTNDVVIWCSRLEPLAG